MTLARLTSSIKQSAAGPVVAKYDVARVAAGQLVQTDVLLPSGALLVAHIEGGIVGDRVSVHDGGMALAEVTAAGFALEPRTMAAVRSAASRAGLSVEGTVLRSQPEALRDARVAIILLANGARSVAEAALAAARKKINDRFRDRVGEQLRAIFGDVSIRHEAPLLGSSRASHRVDWLIRVSLRTQLALDVPLPDGTSIASTVLRQLDIRRAGIGGLRQAIAIDELDDWTSSELSQLAMAEVPVISADHMTDRFRAMFSE